MTAWILGLTGITGIIGLAVLAIVGGPVIPLMTKIADAVFTPIAAVLGTGLAALFKFEIDGGVDILQTGQRIIFALTCCAITWSVAVHHTWTKVHAGYTLQTKQTYTAPVRHTVKRHR
jgi:uncharacterized membrane protein